MNPKSFSAVPKQLRPLAFPYFQMFYTDLCHGPHLGQASSWCAGRGHVEPEASLQSRGSAWEQDLSPPEARSGAHGCSWWHTVQSSASGTVAALRRIYPSGLPVQPYSSPRLFCLYWDYLLFLTFCSLLPWCIANHFTFSCSVFLIYRVRTMLTSKDCRSLNLWKVAPRCVGGKFCLSPKHILNWINVWFCLQLFSVASLTHKKCCYRCFKSCWLWPLLFSSLFFLRCRAHSYAFSLSSFPLAKQLSLPPLYTWRKSAFHLLAYEFSAFWF